jgi:hypothetical protein
MDHIVKKEDYCPPECFVFTYTVEKNIMSGFETVDWETDPEEIG